MKNGLTDIFLTYSYLMLKL